MKDRIRISFIILCLVFISQIAYCEDNNNGLDKGKSIFKKEKKAKKIKVKNKSKIFTKDLTASLVSFALMLSCLALVIFGSSAVSEISTATLMLLGVGISACLGVFAIFCLYRWFIYKKTFLKINIQ